jgi:hypothetical protein
LTEVALFAIKWNFGETKFEIRNPQSAFRNHALVLSFGVTSSTIRFY